MLVFSAPIALANNEKVLTQEPSNGEIQWSPAGIGFCSMENFLAAIAIVKFGEIPLSRLSLTDIRKLYVPNVLKQNFELESIEVFSSLFVHDITFIYNEASFAWWPSVMPADVALNFWGRVSAGNTSYVRSVIYGDIYYYTKVISSPFPQDPDLWNIVWSQYGQAFDAYFLTDLTRNEVLAFCYVNELTSWELEGTAVSISVQGMEKANVFDENGNAINSNAIVIGRGDSFFNLHVNRAGIYTLCRPNVDGTRDVVGYRVLIDEEFHCHMRRHMRQSSLVEGEPRRYQYVLKPGIYTFHVEGVNGEADLLVKHFYDHEVVSYKNFAQTLADQSANQFLINVDSFEVGQTLRVGDDLRLVTLAIGSQVITEAISGETSTMDVVPQIQNDRTLIPVRFIAEKLGADVNWNAETRTVTILLDEQELSMAIGEALPGMDIPAQIIDSRTMVPLRFVAEHFDATVNWHPVTRTIGIIR